jgi:hypothetical protein
VDDNSAKAIGKIVGAGAIVTGSFVNLGDVYGLSLKAINMETAEVAASYPADIAKSTRIETLLASGGGAGTGTQTAQRENTGGNTTVPAAQAPSSAPLAYKIGDKGPAGGLIFYANGLAQADTVPPPVNREYHAGETGPAGGVVFYPVVPVKTAPPPVNREYHAGETGPAGGVVFYPAALVKTAPPPVTREYQVGDTGPAGGVFFYVNPQAGEWKYLEAAPAGTEITAIWTPEGRAVFANNDNVAVGKGLDNTKAIVNHFTQIGGGFGSAAWECNDLVVNGLDDWFLPSRDELSYMYGNLHRKGLGGFSSNWYWSSSSYNHYGSGGANTVSFQDGAQGGDYQHKKYRVRAIRRF